MIYSDDENKRWWESKTHHERAEILQEMTEKLPDFGMSLFRRLEDGIPFSPKQIAAIRKWDR